MAGIHGIDIPSKADFLEYDSALGGSPTPPFRRREGLLRVDLRGAGNALVSSVRVGGGQLAG